MSDDTQQQYEARVREAHAAYRAAVAARQQELLARYAPSACFLSAEETEEAIEREFDAIEAALRAELNAALDQARRDRDAVASFSNSALQNPPKPL